MTTPIKAFGYFVSVHLGADRWSDGEGKTLRAAERQCAADLRRIHREAAKLYRVRDAARDLGLVGAAAVYFGAKIVRAARREWR